jgi:nucleotide-binding universal stress UspA family protein
MASQSFHSILVALDGTASDHKVLSYLSFLNKSLKFERIYFLHVVHSLNLPEPIQKKYADLLAPMDENLEELFKETVGEYFDLEKTSCDFLIREGHVYEEILHYSHIKNVDLMVMGRKSAKDRHKHLSSRLTEQGPCSILLVPETTLPEVHEIIIPTDFSKQSVKTIQMADRLAERFLADLRCIHYYSYASGYLKSGISTVELRSAVSEHSHAQWQDLKSDNGLSPDLNCEFSENEGNMEEQCLSRAHHIGADLMILSSKGRNSSASILLGSFARELTEINRIIPMFILKEKNENLGFFEAIKALL